MKKRTLEVLLFVMVSPSVGKLLATPQAPGSVEGLRSANGQSFTLSWTSPTLRTDGNLLAAGELANFKIIRSNALTGGTTFTSFTVSVASPTSFTDTSVSGRTFFYRVRAVDTAANESSDSTVSASDAQNTATFLADDGSSYAGMPGSFKAALDSQGLILRGTRDSVTEGNRVYKSVNFDVVDNFTGAVRSDYVLGSPVTFGIAYAVDGLGNVVQGNLKPAVSYPDAAGAKFAFSIFWNNGSSWVKLGSSVDTATKVASTQSRLPGPYQLRLVSQPLSGQLNSVYPRAITTNNDGINDRVFFLFENPSQASASGTIFDSQSAKVADLKSTDLFGGDTVLYWDGTEDNGAVAAGGIYIYKLEVGEKRFSGTVAVAR